MKRGLKDLMWKSLRMPRKRSRDFPDEEGTESPHFTVANRRLSSTDAMGPIWRDDFLCLECARGEQSCATPQLI